LKDRSFDSQINKSFSSDKKKVKEIGIKLKNNQKIEEEFFINKLNISSYSKKNLFESGSISRKSSNKSKFFYKKDV
jgi:hypothetical protein